MKRFFSLAASILLTVSNVAVAQMPSFEDQLQRGRTELLEKARRTEPSTSAPRATLRGLESVRAEIDRLLKERAIVLSREENFVLKGSVVGRINGEQVEHSPASMIALGTTLGALIGGGLATAVRLPFFGDYLATGAILGNLGGDGAAFLPTGRGHIEGELHGAIEGRGYHIHEAPSLFALAVLDSGLAAEMERTAQAGGVTPNGCTAALLPYLKALSRKPFVLTMQEGARLMALLREYDRQLTLLRAARVEAADHDTVMTISEFIRDYESWINSKRLSLIHIGAYRPAMDVNHRTMLKLTCNGPWYTPALARQAQARLGAPALIEREDLGEVYLIKPLDYTPAQFSRDYGIQDQPWYTRQESINSCQYLDPSRFQWQKLAVGTAIVPSDGGRLADASEDPERQGLPRAELACRGDAKDAALEFLFKSAKSYDFFLSVPPPALTFTGAR